MKFGLYHVDFNDDERPRTIKKSGEYYKHVIATRRLDGFEDDETKNTKIKTKL